MAISIFQPPIKPTQNKLCYVFVHHDSYVDVEHILPKVGIDPFIFCRQLESDRCFLKFSFLWETGFDPPPPLFLVITHSRGNLQCICRTWYIFIHSNEKAYNMEFLKRKKYSGVRCIWRKYINYTIVRYVSLNTISDKHVS